MESPARLDALYTVVFSPNYLAQVNFRGWAKSVSATSGEGPFDILPQHENLVTMVGETVTIFDIGGKRHDLKLGKALIEASNNLVKVFIEF